MKRPICISFKLSLFSSCLLLLVLGCSRTNVGFVTITCAPRVLDEGDWAILSISQIFDLDDAPVELTESDLGPKTGFAKISEVTHPARGDQPKYRLQIYRIRPGRGSNIVTLTANSFSNLPKGVLSSPITIRLAGE